jgi:protein required for attachment to host cells
MSKTWILAANRTRARLFELDERERSVSEIENFVNPEGRAPAGSRGENRPPRTYDSKGAGRHAIEPHTEPVLKFAERFARRISSVLEDGRTQHKFQQIMLIAPPRFLGHLRNCMPSNLRSCVVREVDKDMTRAKVEAIRTLATEPFQGAK